MKKLLLSVLFTCSVSIAFAQDYGRALINGAANFISNSITQQNQDYKSSTWFTRISYGSFIKPNVALGLSASYFYSNLNSTYINQDPQTGPFTTESKGTSHRYSVGPFVRLYNPLSRKFSFFGQGSALYSYSKSKIKHNNYVLNGGEAYSGHGAEVNISPGFVFFPSNTIGLEMTLGNINYYYSKEGSNPYKHKGFNIGFGLNNMTLGISLYLGRTSAEQRGYKLT